MREPQKSSEHGQLSGIWKSDFTYHSSDRDADFHSCHYVRLHPQGGELVVESLPDINDSYLVARFWLDGNVATGSWQEVTSLDGAYKGVMYHGAAQLIVSPDRESIAGKWVGFGKRMQVNTGPWELTYLGENEEDIKDEQAKPKVAS